MEDYTHRIGRTGRAGANGIALSFVSPKDQGVLRQIEAFTKQKLSPQVVAGLEPSFVLILTEETKVVPSLLLIRRSAFLKIAPRALAERAGMMRLPIYPKTHYVMKDETRASAVESIKKELAWWKMKL